MKKKIIIFIATGCYSGYAPIASGTAGSLFALLLYLPLVQQTSPLIYLAITTVLFFLGVFVSTESEQYFSEKDSSKIVIDEIVGMLITLALFPLDYKIMAIGFVLFRFFDITKPLFGPLEKLSKGWGVMADDVAAGICAHLLLRLIF